MRKIDNSICRSFDVRYTDCFYTDNTNIVSVINFFNEIAQEAGYYYDSERNILEEESLAWIILNWDIDVKRYPSYREKIRVCTLARAIDRFIAYREFLLFDEADMLLARGKSKWILLNLDKRRPALARDYMYELYGVDERKEPFVVHKPLALTEYDIRGRVFPVRKSDVDLYEHVNNCVYPFWIYESLSEQFTSKMFLENLRIFYKRETTYPNDVKVYNKHLDTDHIIHAVRDSTGSNLVYGESFWREKNDSVL